MTEISKIEVQRELVFAFQKEEMVASNTPREVEENNMAPKIYFSTKNDDTPAPKNWGRYWRQKTRPKNKLGMNMKTILNSKFQKNVVTIIEDSSNDEDIQVANEEYHTIDQTLEEIHEELRHTPDYRGSL